MTGIQTGTNWKFMLQRCTNWKFMLQRCPLIYGLHYNWKLATGNWKLLLYTYCLPSKTLK